MKIIVLGSTGMLGNYVYNYVKKHNKNVIAIQRKDFEIDHNFSYDMLKMFLSKLELNPDDVIINCIGLIKPQVDKYGQTLSIIVNSIFPNILSDVCDLLNVKLIHITTDCVFSGERGLYTENDVHDVTDLYGRSKSLGEPKNCTVIRTSIIGEEINQSRSLIEWIKSRKNQDANGYEDHLWNGVTCLQLAEVINKIIDNKLYWLGVRHIFSNVVSKYELLKIVNSIYNLNIDVKKVKSNKKCDRTLFSIYESIFEIPTLDVQIEKMNNFRI